MRTFQKIAVCLAVVLAASSCSSDGGSDDGASEPRRTTTTKPATTTTTEDKLADLPEPTSYDGAVAANIASGASGVEVTAEEAECIAPKWVAVAKVERLEAAGITPADVQQGIDVALLKLQLTEEEGVALVDAMTSCGLDLRALYLESPTVSGSDADAKACLEEAVSEDFVRRLLVVSLTLGPDKAGDDPALVEGLRTLIAACP